MSVYDWPNDFIWPYAGQPRIVPPDFKERMVRVQDQIYWLLNAVYKLNDGAISEVVAEGIAESAERRANRYTDAEVHDLEVQLADLYEQIRNLNMQISSTRNPATGMNDYTYTALVQMYDLMRPHACTWGELDASGKTWNELDNSALTWWEFDVYGNSEFLGDEDVNVRATPAGHIEVGTPGYVPALFQNGHSYDELDAHGFMYVRTAE